VERRKDLDIETQRLRASVKQITAALRHFLELSRQMVATGDPVHFTRYEARFLRSEQNVDRCKLSGLTGPFHWYV
jgi:hypothetical protein